jgi:hypothetical protein
LEHLHGDAVAGLHAPTLGRFWTDGLDHADRLVTGHEGEAGGERAAVLLVVGAAQTARLDPKESVVVAHVRQWQVTSDELPRLLEHQGAGELAT